MPEGTRFFGELGRLYDGRKRRARNWHATLAEVSATTRTAKAKGKGENTVMRLVWFRNDLRLADNPALRHACAGDEPVAALFIVSPTQWQAHKLAPVRQRFMLAQVDAMGRELAASAFRFICCGSRPLPRCRRR